MKMLLGNKTDSFSLTILLGISFFSIWICILAFFIPLTFYVELVLLIISLIPYCLKKLRIYMVSFPIVLLKSTWFWIFCVIIIIAGTYYPFIPDHYYYYKPTLNWLNQYGLITGVANIKWSIGQMSVFHIIQAGLDQTIDLFQRINVFFSILFLVYIFERKAYLLLLVIPIYFFFIQTSSPDVAIIYMSLIIVNELFFNYKEDNYKILFLISVFTFTIKPVAFWLPIWIFFAGFFLNKKELTDYRIYLFPALFIVLFLIKNVIASSTLFYPLAFTRLNTYWLTDLRFLELSDENASVLTFHKFFTKDAISTMSFFQKIYYWLSIKEFRTIINWIIILTVAVFGIFSFIKKNTVYLLLWIIILIKMIVTFIFSGQFRFLLDGVYPLLFIMFHHVRISKVKTIVAGFLFSILFLTLISYPSLFKQRIPGLKLTEWMKGFSKDTLLLPGKYNEKKHTQAKIGNLEFNISAYVFIFDTPPPAFNYYRLNQFYSLGVFPQMKDTNNIRRGYYMKTLEAEEKEKLKEIIREYYPE